MKPPHRRREKKQPPFHLVASKLKIENVQFENEKGREREREYVCVCERERERERPARIFISSKTKFPPNLLRAQ